MKIGVVPYYNCLPLTFGLESQMVALPPSELTTALLNGDIDVGLIPSFAILKHQLHAYPEAGVIACDGAVQSVGFFTRDGMELADIESIYYDGESQTSVALAKIILNKAFNRNLRSLKTVNLTNLSQADALVLIGDKALFFQEPGYRFWDLGELWQQLTGTGFMFAAWASTRLLTPEEFATLKLAKENGLRHLDRLIANTPLAKQTLLKKYLTDTIVFQDTPAVRKGYARFHTMLDELQLLNPSEIILDLDFETLMRTSA